MGATEGFYRGREESILRKPAGCRGMASSDEAWGVSSIDAHGVKFRLGSMWF